MTDISSTVAPKSDQLNADDLIAGPMTIKVAAVSLLAGEQPVAIEWEGGRGRPYKPCKSMRRVLIYAWGKNGNDYIGKSMTLYRDATVAFGGAAVGGIRISHMSDLEKDPMTVALMVTRGNRKPYTVKRLAPGATQAQAPEFDPEAFLTTVREKCAEATDPDALKSWWESGEVVTSRKRLANASADKSAEARTLFSEKIGILSAGDEV